MKTEKNSHTKRFLFSIKENLYEFKELIGAIIISIPLTVIIHEFGHFLFDTLSTGKIRGYFVILPGAFGYQLKNNYEVNEINLIGGHLLVFIFILLVYYLYFHTNNNKTKLFLYGLSIFPFMLILISILFAPFNYTGDIYKIAVLQRADVTIISTMLLITYFAILTDFLLLMSPKNKE